MKNFNFKNICTIFMALALCTGFYSCGDDNGDTPSRIEDVNTVPGEEGYVQPSKIEILRESMTFMCEGENGNPQITTWIPYNYSYKEYAGTKIGSVRVYSQVKHPAKPADEAYKVERKEDTEPAPRKIEYGDVYWDSKQDFDIQGDNDTNRKETVTMRRYFRDFKYVTDMTDADWNLTLEFQLPIKVKAATGLVTEEISYTQAELNDFMISGTEPGSYEWELDIDLETDPNIPRSTLKLALGVKYVNDWHIFQGPTKTFTYDPTILGK